MNIYAQAAGEAYRRHYAAVSKQAGAFRVHSSFGTCFLLQRWPIGRRSSAKRQKVDDVVGQSRDRPVVFPGVIVGSAQWTEDVR